MAEPSEEREAEERRENYERMASQLKEGLNGFPTEAEFNPPTPYPSDVPRSRLDRQMDPLREAVLQSDPIAVARAISRVQKRIEILERDLGLSTARSEQAYLSTELRRYFTDSQGFMRKLQYAQAPSGFFSRWDEINGVRIRGNVNLLLAVEEVLRGNLESAADLKMLHWVADQLSISWQEASFEILISALEKRVQKMSADLEVSTPDEAEVHVEAARALLEAALQHERAGPALRQALEQKGDAAALEKSVAEILVLEMVRKASPQIREMRVWKDAARIAVATKR